MSVLSVTAVALAWSAQSCLCLTCSTACVVPDYVMQEVMTQVFVEQVGKFIDSYKALHKCHTHATLPPHHQAQLRGHF